MTYKEIQRECERKAKTVGYPTATDSRGFPVDPLSSGPSRFIRRAGMVLTYRDGTQYVVMSNGSQCRLQ